MIKYELTLVTKDEENDYEIKAIDKVQHGSLEGLLAQFILVIARAARIECQDAIAKIKGLDDIPF